MTDLLHIDYLADELQHHPHKWYAHRDVEQVRRIILHASGTATGTATSFARYHVNTLGWPGIGYHLVADANGMHQTQDFNTISYHCSGQNTQSIGICHTGDFDKRPPTDEEYYHYIYMVLYTEQQLGRQLPISYHNDFTDRKTCPGKLFDKEYFEYHLRDFRWLYQ